MSSADIVPDAIPSATLPPPSMTTTDGVGRAAAVDSRAVDLSCIESGNTDDHEQGGDGAGPRRG